MLEQNGFVTRETFADESHGGERVEIVRITKAGRIALNAFLDAVGISRRELRAAARRAAREFGRLQPPQ
jgi:DNA-binding PadR family transcriptional regulator